MIPIETDRLIIRESSGRDFSRIYSMMLSEKTGAVRDRVSMDEDEELEKFLAYIHTVYSVFGFGLWTVCLKETERRFPESVASEPQSVPGAQFMQGLKEEGETIIIGRCGLQPIADENSPLGRIELGYLIAPEYRGKGYAYEACKAILEYAFKALRIEEVFAEIDLENTASVHLAEKLGFRKSAEHLWVLGNPQMAEKHG